MQCSMIDGKTKTEVGISLGISVFVKNLLCRVFLNIYSNLLMVDMNPQMLNCPAKCWTADNYAWYLILLHASLTL